MKTKDKAIEKAIEGLRNMSARIDEMEVQASLAKAETREKYLATLNDLRKKKSDLERRIDQLGQSGKDAGDTVARGIAGAYEELSSALRSAVETIKKG